MPFLKKLKEFYLLIFTVFIYLFHLPFAVAKSAAGLKWLPDSTGEKTVHSDMSKPEDVVNEYSIYDSLRLQWTHLNRQAFEYAKKGFLKLKEQGSILNDSILTIIDFSQPSSQKRLYVLDLKNFKLLINTFVAHGKNSGREWAGSFSNTPRSYKSSLGFFVTGNIYEGKKGYSLRLQGVEPGFNDKAYKRAIVVHGAGYVSQDFINTQGFIGRSEGCPAVPVQEAEPLIDQIKEGSCLFIYSPDSYYLRHSSVLN